MGHLSEAYFSARIGQAFTVGERENGASLVLARVDSAPGGLRPGGSFSLVFRGPAAEPLPQGTRTLAQGGDENEIFLVPIGRDGDGLLYEAVFN